MEKEKTKWWQKIIDIILVVLVIILIFLAYGLGINNRFYKLMVVTSGSMSPVFEAGDVICIRRVDPADIKVGDIVTFQTMDNEILTHRIVEIKSDGEIVTRGDANNTNDVWSDGWKLGEVETKYVFRIPYLGYGISWIRGLFPAGINTGAWMTNTESTTCNVAAAVWEVPTPMPTPEVTPTPEIIVTPEIMPILEEEPMPTPTEEILLVDGEEENEIE